MKRAFPGAAGLSSASLLDKLPKKIHPHAKSIHEIHMAPTRKDALAAYQTFLDIYEAKYPKVCECLCKDEERLFTFYDFPAEYWRHIRTTNPIESTFSMVRLRTRRKKKPQLRGGDSDDVLYGLEAQKNWRRLNRSPLLAQVIEGVKSMHGVKQGEKAA